MKVEAEPWEEGQERGPRASEIVFQKVKVASVCFCRTLFVFGTELAISQSPKTFVS